MKTLSTFWNTIRLGRKDLLHAARALAILIFVSILGMIVGEQLHSDGLVGFFVGAALAMCLLLIGQLFQISSVECRSDTESSETIELHLSR
jgi:hypothetical protein